MLIDWCCKFRADKPAIGPSRDESGGGAGWDWADCGGLAGREGELWTGMAGASLLELGAGSWELGTTQARRQELLG